MSLIDDRDIVELGAHLKGQSIDIVVGGGIACVDAVKLIREFRRYGAEVRVIMTRAAQNFVQPLIFEWASKQPVLTQLSGSAEHLSGADAAVVFPATLDLIGRLSAGLADEAALTTLQSLLGRKPIILVPSMHEQLWQNPLFQERNQQLTKIKALHILEPVVDEGKRKSPPVDDIVQRSLHILANGPLKSKNIIVTAGATLSPIDSVRFVSNRSSGATALSIASELYRRGAIPCVVKGVTSVEFPSRIDYLPVETVAEMKRLTLERVRALKPVAAIFAAAALDYSVSKPLKGKTSSRRKLSVTLIPSEKIIDAVQARGLIKVGFKLEAEGNQNELHQRVQQWNEKKFCDLVVANSLAMLRGAYRRAILVNAGGKLIATTLSNHELASQLCTWLETTLETGRT